MWDSHKLRTKGFSPIQLFSLRIEELKRQSLINEKNYTEVQHFHIDPELVNTIQNDCIKGVRGVKVPGIASPSHDTVAQLRDNYPTIDLPFENSV